MVTTIDGKILKYQHIVSEDEVYNGTNIKSGRSTVTPIDQAKIDKVFIKNKSASTWVTVAVITIPVLAMAIIIPTLPWLGDESFFPTEGSNPFDLIYFTLTKKCPVF